MHGGVSFAAKISNNRDCMTSGNPLFAYFQNSKNSVLSGSKLALCHLVLHNTYETQSPLSSQLHLWKSHITTTLSNRSPNADIKQIHEEWRNSNHYNARDDESHVKLEWSMEEDPFEFSSVLCIHMVQDASPCNPKCIQMQPVTWKVIFAAIPESRGSKWLLLIKNFMDMQERNRSWAWHSPHL